MIDLETARRWYAEGLGFQAPAQSDAVIAAFAKVPREAFLGPPPWRLLAGGRDHGPIETDDPRQLYHDILVAIDPARNLNNGQPSLWAYLYDQLHLKPGERVCHVGAGIIHCASGRGIDQASRLAAALGRPAPLGPKVVRSLRRDAHDRGPCCWLHEDGYCLSTLPVDAARQ